MITRIEDTLAIHPPQSAYHHHFMGTFCSPELIEVYETGIKPEELFQRWTSWQPMWKGKWVPPEHLDRAVVGQE
jgi:hypothetical protein